MTPSQLINEIKDEKLEPVYFLFGEERFYHMEITCALRSKIVTEENQEFNLEIFEAKSTSIEEWIGAANTFSFLGGRKLVIVRDLHEASLDRKSTELLENYVEQPAPETCLVLTADKVNRKRKLDKILIGLKTAVNCCAPKEAALSLWLQSRAKTFGIELLTNASRMMVDQIGAKPGILATELEKVIAYAGDEKKIDEVLVGEVIGALKLENIFELTDALKAKDHANALRLLKRQIHHGQEPLKVLGAITWQFRLIWEVRHHMKNRLSAVDISRATGLRPFAVEKIMPFAKAFSQKELHKSFEHFFQTDRALKTSGSEPERVMEGLILGLCSSS